MTFNTFVAGWFILAVIIFITLFFIPVPYGRYTARKGRQLPDALGWVIMELPAVAVLGSMFLLGSAPRSAAGFVFLALWMSHYGHRALIYPFSRRHTKKHGMPWWIVGLGFTFNCINGYLNGHYLFEIRDYTDQWLTDWRFITGAGIFIIGYIINRDADSTLRKLRLTGENGYGLSDRGLYSLISCPNYFGEIILWFGWALCTWSIPGLSFAVWTTANLVPRARAHHQWYREMFPGYPRNRKALIPWIW